MRRYRRSLPGFTLIELLLYVTLASVVSTAVLAASWNIIRLEEESFWYQAGTADVSRAVVRINTLIRNADSVALVGTDRLELGVLGSSDTVSVSLEDGVIVVDTGEPIALTGDAVTITTLRFSSVAPDTNGAALVRYELVADSVFPEYNWTISFQGGAEMRSVFNQE